MSYADPNVDITYATVNQSLPRIYSASPNKGAYRKTTGEFVLTISHLNSGNRVRSMYRLDRFVDVNADNILESYGAYLVLDRPLTGFSETDVVNLVTALCGGLTASSGASIKKLNNQEV